MSSVNNHHTNEKGKSAAGPIPSPTRPKKILIVEDDELTRNQLREVLQAGPEFEVDTVTNGEEALAQLEDQHYSLLLTDLRMPGGDGMDLIRQVQERRLPVTVIVTTGQGSVQEAVQAIRMGAYDFLTKPVDVDHLKIVLQRALCERALRDELADLRAQVNSRYSFFHMVSKSPRMHNIFELITQLGNTNTTVLIEGETGTGKELVARAIHHSSVRKDGPLIPINCAAVPETLLESELFGHEKGSFTSAVGQRKGRFEQADGGTIFLDEIGDIPAPMQVKLLRVLQERKFERIGGTASIEVDVRVVAATNRNLKRLVQEGKFREDLYYRLNVVKLDLPPLRERTEDIPILATHFCEKYTPPGEPTKRLSPRAMEVLLNHHWPGNIRELENVIERACVTTRGEVIEADNLPADLTNPGSPSLPVHVDLRRPLPELLRQAVTRIEQQYIRKALSRTRGHVGRAAKICGVSRRSITAKIAEYNLDRAAFKDA